MDIIAKRRGVYRINENIVPHSDKDRGKGIVGPDDVGDVSGVGVDDRLIGSYLTR